MEISTVKLLEEKFADILNAGFKSLPKKITTLFDIAEFPEREKVISNFYAYYFDPSREHGFGDLFIATLSKLIAIRTNSEEVIKNYSFCKVDKEFRTDKGNFIDIVIVEPSANDNVNESAIIIENKINAPVYNALDDYYQSIFATNKKIGVVLSIKNESKLPKEFINITHLELITKVEQASGFYFLNADAKNLFILKEFIQNIKSMTQINDLSNYYDFYFEHENKIQEIAKLHDAIVADVFRQANEACSKLDMGLELKATNTNSLRFYTSTKTPAVYFKIWLKDLMTDAAYMCIVVELNEEGIKYLDEINRIEFTQEENALLKEINKTRKSYLQYAKKCFNPEKEQIKNFTEYIYDMITNTPLKSIFLKIENVLTELKAYNK